MRPCKHSGIASAFQMLSIGSLLDRYVRYIQDLANVLVCEVKFFEDTYFLLNYENGSLI